MGFRATTFASLLLLTPALPAQAAPALAARAAEGAAGLRADYDRLRQGRYSAAAVAVPPEGLRWSFAGGAWSLESGRLWFAEPVSGGAVTGLVFEGRGTFHLEVSDATELIQLRRFARRPALTALDLPFSSFVFRFGGASPFPDLPWPAVSTAASDDGFGPLKLAQERQEHWLVKRWIDADERVLAALATPGDAVLRMEMKTDEFDWLTFDYDTRRMEEIRVESYNSTYSWEEVWLSLDRPEDRDLRGRPASRLRSPVDLLHFDVDADLTQAGRDKGWMKGRFQVGMRFRTTPDAAPGTRAVQLYLNAFAKVSAVREGGRDLPFVRDAIGERDRGLDDRLFDNSLLVLLDEPLAPGQERTLEVDYELELRNYAGGRSWYPGTDGDETILSDSHTGRLRLTVRSRHEARAMGSLAEGEGSVGAGKETTVWTVDRPTKMLSFVYTEEKFHEERVAAEGGPEVICFGERVGLSTTTKFHNVGADVANSLSYFSQLLGVPLPRQRFYVTAIDGNHGQSFDGFLELSQASFEAESPGATELFRAHEVAHQWWGHLVGPASYRDVWLGEAFAEYSAMNFVREAVPKGDKLFQEILTAYAEELNGSLKSGFSKFARPGVSLVNRAYGDRIGPIGLGWRASTGEVRSAYSSQVYDKGALVLHMLRRLVGDLTGDDRTFFAILRDFLAAHRGGLASTADFEAAVAHRVPADWSWFFDEWVRGTVIPSYRWTYQLLPNPNDRGQFLAQLEVHQRDAPEGFKMSVPVEALLADGSTTRTRVMVDRADQVYNLTFPQRPKSLTFNPEGEVLSRTKRE